MLRKLNLFTGLSFFVISSLFYFFPTLDIKISDYFYTPTEGFTHNNDFLIKFIFRAVPNLTSLYIIILIYKIFRLKSYKSFRTIIQQPVVIILLSCALGPGLIVNYSLKDHFGRARPKQIIEFEGASTFTKVYQPSNQCSKNCSFSSGHAAMAFNFSTIAYLASPFKRISIFVSGVIFGVIVGIGRIVQGGHFASDILASGGIMFVLNAALFYLHYLLIKNKPSR